MDHYPSTHLSCLIGTIITFLLWQALVELNDNFLAAFENMLIDKLPVICEYVHDEFTSIILTNGGPREKQRAQILLSQLK